jgi:hypothetical protein
MGRNGLWERKGATDEEFRHTRRMFYPACSSPTSFMYFIILSTGLPCTKQTERT